MADLTSTFCGIRSPNPFWLASAPPANSGEQIMRAFDAGWGGAVWKTLGEPIVNVSSRFGSIDYRGARAVGFNNIELITDRPISTNLKEIYETKKRYPKHAVIVSLMVESRDQWQDLIKRAEDTGADGLELNFGCPHGMCERGMGSAVGQEPKILTEITSWAKEFARTPVIVKLTPNISDIREPGLAAVKGGADAVSLINTIKSIMGVDLNTFVPKPVVGNESTNGGYCGPAVKPIAQHMVASLARTSGFGIPISGIGGVSDWRDAAEFMALGATNVQVCTAVMINGYRIVEDMIEGLSDYLDSMGMTSVEQLIGRAIPHYTDWQHLDLNYKVVARINQDSCIGCQRCYTACLDGAHQCIHTDSGPCQAWHGESDHGMNPRAEVAAVVQHESRRSGGIQVPWIDEAECVGCNLCQIVCPVPDCISMEQIPSDQGRESWSDRARLGKTQIHNGLNG